MNDGSDLAMGKARLAVCFVVLFLFLLGGCSKQPTAPSEYVLGDNKLPALQEALGSDEKIKRRIFRVFGSRYTREILCLFGFRKREGHGFRICFLSDRKRRTALLLTPKGRFRKIQRFQGIREVLRPVSETEEDGVFFLEIVWKENSCIITPVFREDMKIHTQETDGGVLNLNEIVSRFEAYTPSELGLSGESMEEYSIFPEEGYVMVNDQPGIRVNIYNPSTHAYQASYIITSDGSHVFHWDRKTQQIEEVPAK